MPMSHTLNLRSLAQSISLSLRSLAEGKIRALLLLHQFAFFNFVYVPLAQGKHRALLLKVKFMLCCYFN